MEFLEKIKENGTLPQWAVDAINGVPNQNNPLCKILLLLKDNPNIPNKRELVDISLLLINSGVDLTKGLSGSTWGVDIDLPIHIAAEIGDCEILNAIIEQSSKLRLNINIKGETGSTALLKATELGNLEAVRLLVRIGCDISIQDNYKSNALLQSLLNPENINLAIVKVFLENLTVNTFINYQHPINQNTALHLAVIARNFEAVKMLLSAGASINLTNENGKNPLDLANELQTESKSDTKLKASIIAALKEHARHTFSCPPELTSLTDQVHYLVARQCFVDQKTGKYKQKTLVPSEQEFVNKVMKALRSGALDTNAKLTPALLKLTKYTQRVGTTSEFTKDLQYKITQLVSKHKDRTSTSTRFSSTPVPIENPKIQTNKGLD